MATISRATFETKVNATLSLEGPEVSSQALTPSVFNPATQSFTSTSTPPGTQYYAEEITFPSSGSQTQTIALDSWTDTEGRAKSSTGLKVQVFRAQADSDNVGDVTIEGAAADPYELFGSGIAVDVPPGGSITCYFADQLSDVGPTSGGGATDIKLTGTGGDTVKIEMIIG